MCPACLMSCKATRGQPAHHTCIAKVQVEEKEGGILQGAEAGAGGDRAGGDRSCASRTGGKKEQALLPSSCSCLAPCQEAVSCHPPLPWRGPQRVSQPRKIPQCRLILSAGCDKPDFRKET